MPDSHRYHLNRCLINNVIDAATNQTSSLLNFDRYIDFILPKLYSYHPARVVQTPEIGTGLKKTTFILLLNLYFVVCIYST